MFFKVKVSRSQYRNAPRFLIVKADKTQDAICITATQLRDEGITDARAIEVVCQVQSLRG